MIVDLNHPLTRWARIPREAKPSLKQIFHTMSPCEGLQYVHFRNITQKQVETDHDFWNLFQGDGPNSGAPVLFRTMFVALFFDVLSRTTIRGNMVYVSIMSSNAWRPTVQRWHQKSYIWFWFWFWSQASDTVGSKETPVGRVLPQWKPSDIFKGCNSSVYWAHLVWCVG